MARSETMDDFDTPKLWLAVDPVNMNFVMICNRCAQRLVAAEAASIPDQTGNLDSPVPVVVFSPGYTAENTGVKH